MTRWALFLALAVALVLSALPAAADVTAQEVEQARQELRELSSALEDQVAAYEQAVAEEAQLRDRVDSLVVALSARERDLVIARREAKVRATAMYMSAGTDLGAGTIVSPRSMAQAPARYVYLHSVSETDREVVNRLETARRDYEQQKALLDEAVEVQSGLRADIDVVLTAIYDQLEEANQRYQSIKTEWDAQERERIAREQHQLWLSTSTTTTTAPLTTTTAGTQVTSATTVAPTTTSASTTTTPPTTVPPPDLPAGTMVCPIDGATTFRDSWGEPRSGGRGHKGVDMMALRWTPIVAIESGTIYRISWSSLGGLGVYLLGDSGLWYYAHNEATAEGLHEGQAVGAGQRIAYVGSSGNAGIPHLHLGWMPNADWVFQNPFPIVDELCR